MPRHYPPESDLETALIDLDEAREYEATYYMVLVLKLLRRLNAVEDCPDRSLQNVLCDLESNDKESTPWPVDDVILADPYWLVNNPIRRGSLKSKPMPLAEALKEAAGRFK